MKQRPWEQVLAALMRVGCYVVTDTPFQVLVCRGGVKLAMLRKWSPTRVLDQRRIIDQLDLSESEFLAAVDAH